MSINRTNLLEDNERETEALGYLDATHKCARDNEGCTNGNMLCSECGYWLEFVEGLGWYFVNPHLHGPIDDAF